MGNPRCSWSGRGTAASDWAVHHQAGDMGVIGYARHVKPLGTDVFESPDVLRKDEIAGAQMIRSSRVPMRVVPGKVRQIGRTATLPDVVADAMRLIESNTGNRAANVRFEFDP